MTLTLNLPAELEQRLKIEAQRNGLAAEDFTLQLLEKQLPSQKREDRRKELIALVQSWIDDPDVEEQKETGEYLIRVLDEDRPSERKLFPPELKGISW